MKKTLIFLGSVVGMTAIVFGALLVIYPDGTIIDLPLSLLKFTPFKDFTIPGLILSVIVGGANLYAGILHLYNRPGRFAWSTWAGTLLCGWIIVQIVLIRQLNGLQLLFAAIGVVIVILSRKLSITRSLCN